MFTFDIARTVAKMRANETQVAQHVVYNRSEKYEVFTAGADTFGYALILIVQPDAKK